jgi:hypothetical protein
MRIKDLMIKKMCNVNISGMFFRFCMATYPGSTVNVESRNSFK